ncbi:MAG TPA: TauD/TfdA family dioxygenase [Longimicrobiaceae bacterium]|nr:TauD/TfdA family dioxygenase [Longimicrobiaceae bacterium]
METTNPGAPGLKSIGAIKRRTAVASEESVTRSHPMFPDGGVPLVVEPAADDVDLVSWARAEAKRLDAQLLEHGGILFRGFRMETPDDFERFIAAVSGELLEYRERSSPRSQVSGNVYTSTEHPASQPIFLHNENSYQHTWPRKIFFMCDVEPQEGGETPLADTRRVGKRLPEEIRRRFAEKGVMYVRNYGGGVGLSWQNVFQTEDPREVEAYCEGAGLQPEWKDGDRLRTRAVRPAFVRHPVTGEELWFNHAVFFHVTTLEPTVREALLASFAEEDLPGNTYYGDGTPIEPEVMDALRAIYDEETVVFPWRRGDVLMLDNMTVAHGRSPFRGPRRILAGMSEPVSRDQV